MIVTDLEKKQRNHFISFIYTFLLLVGLNDLLLAGGFFKVKHVKPLFIFYPLQVSWETISNY